MSSRRSSLQDHHRHHHSPSFSSTLLDDIYRSFDNHDTHTHHLNHTNNYFDTENRFDDVDRWINNEKIKIRPASLPEGILRRRPVNYSSSTTSSSDSCASSGVFGFSSSDSDSLYRSSRQKPPLKAIRTAAKQGEIRRETYSDEIPAAKKKKKEGNQLHRRALKLYDELKKVKQPISPGGKLANFLNSLFNSNSSLKSSKPKSSSSERETVSAPSTASRSCLSKTPSSAGRFEKRSVRFVDEESRRQVTSSTRNVGADVAKRDSSVILAKELLKNYHQQQHNNNRKKELLKVDFLSARHHHHDLRLEDHDDDEDAMSCCSSDLFELENWLEIGADHHELPVYETTRFVPNRNKAIAI